MIHAKSLILGAAMASVFASAFAVSAQVNPNGQPAPPPPPLPDKQLTGPENLSHFQCYRLAPGPVAFKPVALTTVDQFGKQDIVIGQPLQICNPTVKYHDGRKFAVVDAKAHLICYQIVKQPAVGAKTIKTQNQFAVAGFKTGARGMFCAPSYKKLVGQKEFPLE